MERDDELRRHIGVLWRTAMSGLGTVREVVVRSTQSGKLRLDIAVLQRERAQLLEHLGGLTAHLVESGLFPDVPDSLAELVYRVREVEARLRADTARAADNAFGAPRGFEPEAASDYGDEISGYDESDAEESPIEPPPAPIQPARKIRARARAGAPAAAITDDESAASTSKKRAASPTRKKPNTTSRRKPRTGI